MSNLDQFLVDAMEDKRPIEKEYEDNDIAVPEEFRFYSKVIVISNMEDKPDYLDDKTLSIRLDFGKEDSVKELHTKLESLLNEYPEISLEDKLAVLNIYNANKKGNPKIGMEQFLKMCLIYKADLPNSEKWIRAQIEKK